MDIPTGHNGGICTIKILPKNTIVTASYDQTARIISQNPQSNKWTLLTQQEHTNPVLGIDYVQKNTLVTGSSDGQLKIWDAETGIAQKTFGESENTGLYSLAMVDTNTVVTGSVFKPSNGQAYEHHIKLWDIQNSEPFATLLGHQNNISAIIKWKQGFISTSWDTTVRIWNLNPLKSVKVLNGHTSYIYCAALVNNQQVLATSGKDCSIILWNLETCQSDSFNRLERVHENSVYALASLTNHLFISAAKDRTIRIWDVRTYSLVRKIDTNFCPYAVGALPNGNIIASGASTSGSGRLATFTFI